MKKRDAILVYLAVLLLTLAVPVTATDTGKLLKGAADTLGFEKDSPSESSFMLGDEEQKVSGIKEALTVGIRNAVKKVGITNGYYKNERIKIMLPENLRVVDEFIGKVGGDQLSDTLVEKMNRAAEKAAPRAEAIFVDTIRNLKIEDATNILTGQDDAATTYLKKNTSESLQASFYPVVKSTMEEINTIKTYNDYVGKYSSNPLGQMIDMDINQYVTEEAIDGLFIMVAKEEKKIREDPAARVTDLLKQVFGGN